MKVGIVRCLLASAALLCPFHAQSQNSLQTQHGHVRPAVANGQAALLGSLPRTQVIHASIVLPLRNQSELSSLLSRIYDPASPDYHHFLGVDQFTEEFGPTEKDYQSVVDFARANGFAVTSTPANRIIVPMSGSADQIEKAFHVRMNLYRHPTEDRTFYSPDREPSLDLAVPVAHIAGLNNFSLPRPLVKPASAAAAQTAPATVATGSGPNGSYLASDMRAAYYGGTALTGAGQTVALVEYGGYSLADVNKTFSSVGQSYTVPIRNVLLDGETGAPNSGSDVEEVLDIVQAIGMAPGLSQVRVYIGDLDTDVLNAIASEDLAKQISISWSWNPDDPATDDPFFMEFAAQGQSVFVASGDEGSFDPLWNSLYPAEDAYVTAVGGTDLVTNGKGGPWASETAWTGSGGGVSPDRIPVPSWQHSIANSSNKASATLRNVPDLAMEANSDNYACNMGACSLWGGTSFAAPRWAGFMALVNQQNAAASNPSIGFFNPALYALGAGSNYAAAFHDVVVGNNNYENDCCGWPYYNAVPGYDLVTGWGTPAGQDLIDALVPPTTPVFEISMLGVSYVSPGHSGPNFVTITRHGSFNGPVQLVISGMPAEVTATVSQNPVPAGQYGVIIFSANSNAQPGSYLLKLTGISGSSTYTTDVALQVGKPFKILTFPAKVSVPQGGTNSSEIFVTGAANGVSLAVTSGLPSGVTATWLPDPTTGFIALMLSASTSVPVNTHAMLTITGINGGEIETANIAVIINAPKPNLSVSPVPTVLAQGASYTSVVTVVPSGNYGGPLALSATGLPRGVTATFKPSSTSTSSSLTLTAAASAAISSSSITIEATTPSGFFTSYSFPLTITATPTPSFALGTSPPALVVAGGRSVQTTISINPANGFTGKVNLAFSPEHPAGVTSAFSANPVTGSSIATFTASSTAVPGFYAIPIQGVSGSLQSITYVYLTVTPPPAFSLSTSAASLTVKQGGSVTDTVSVKPGTGFSGNAILSAVSLPAGVTASFSTNPTSGASLLTLQASKTTLPGNYTMMIVGTCNGVTAATTIPLTVQFAAPIQTSTALSTLSSFSSRPYPGDTAFTLIATVTPISGSEAVPGNVLFHIGSGNYLIPVNALNVAKYNGISPSAPGNLTYSAAYQGSTDFSPSSSSTLTVPILASTKTALSINPASATLIGGSKFTLTAKVSSVGVSIVPSGIVQFFLGSPGLYANVALNSSGVATCTGTVPATGILQVVAYYLGDNKLYSSTSQQLQATIIPASMTSLSVTPTGNLTAASLYTLTAKVSAAATTGTPAGNVVFQLGSTPWTVKLNSSGVATLGARAPFAAGPLSLTATYQGSSAFAPSTSNTLHEVITAIPTTTALSIAPAGSLTAGSAYTLTAKVTPAGITAVAAGNVIFHLGSSTQTVALSSSGFAIYHGVAPSTAGPLSITANYQGNTEFAASVSNTLSETIKATSTAKASSITANRPAAADSAYTLTAR